MSDPFAQLARVGYYNSDVCCPHCSRSECPRDASGYWACVTAAIESEPDPRATEPCPACKAATGVRCEPDCEFYDDLP